MPENTKPNTDGVEISRRHHAVIRYNPLVYAGIVEGDMAGLILRKSVNRGDILCAYEGVRLPRKMTATSKSEYIMRMLVRTRAGKDFRDYADFDGEGRLAGYANYAGCHAANAMVWDVGVRKASRRRSKIR